MNTLFTLILFILLFVAKILILTGFIFVIVYIC